MFGVAWGWAAAARFANRAFRALSVELNRMLDSCIIVIPYASALHFVVDRGADRALVFAVRVDRDVVDLLLDVRAPASAAGATRAARSRARTMRYMCCASGWHSSR